MCPLSLLRCGRNGRLRLPCEGLCPRSPCCSAGRWVAAAALRRCAGSSLFPYCPARVVGGWWVAAAALRRLQMNFMREDVAFVAMRCSCLPGGLYWLSVAKVATRVVPPGSGASAFMINFVYAMSLALWLWDQLASEPVVLTARRDLAVTNAVCVGLLGSGGGESN